MPPSEHDGLKYRLCRFSLYPFSPVQYNTTNKIHTLEVAILVTRVDYAHRGSNADSLYLCSLVRQGDYDGNLQGFRKVLNGLRATPVIPRSEPVGLRGLQGSRTGGNPVMNDVASDEKLSDAI